MRREPLFISHFQKPEPPKSGRKDERNSSRSELRDLFDGQLVTVSGRLDAKLWYATEPYAKRVVYGLGYKFNEDPGWPSDIPFMDLNRIPGGTRIFRRLLSLSNNGLLRFVKATEEDKRNACLDARLVIPNAAQRAAALAIPRAPFRKPVGPITGLASRFQLSAPPSSETTGIVLHPATMNPHFTFSFLPDGTGTRNASDASNARRPERAQRSDINKSRKRPITNPEGRELRHPKRGPLTAKCVVEAYGIAADDVEQAIKSRKILLTDEILTGCTEVGREACGSRSRLHDLEVGSPETEEIESRDDRE